MSWIDALIYENILYMICFDIYPISNNIYFQLSISTLYIAIKYLQLYTGYLSNVTNNTAIHVAVYLYINEWLMATHSFKCNQIEGMTLQEPLLLS